MARRARPAAYAGSPPRRAHPPHGREPRVRHHVRGSGGVHETVDGALDLQAGARRIDDGKHLHHLRRAAVPGAFSAAETCHSDSAVISRANGGTEMRKTLVTVFLVEFGLLIV